MLIKQIAEKHPDIYPSPKLYGCDEILKTYLDLPVDQYLPITIPHGIDFYNQNVPVDIHCHEPLYMAFNDYIADRASRYKSVLMFPHMWLFIIQKHKQIVGEGTLFIAPPPSKKDFERMLDKIDQGDYPKPWGVLIKDRGVRAEDFKWWVSRGFSVHTAGTISGKHFYYRLRDIFSKYSYVASPNMSGAVVFAVAMGRKAFSIPDVQLDVASSVYSSYSIPCGRRERVIDTWQTLLSCDVLSASSQANELLGAKYIDTPENLRVKLMEAIKSTSNRPLHLFPLREGKLYELIIWLVKKGIPAHRLFPNPLKKLFSRIAGIVRLNRLNVTSGSDFAHHGIVGSSGPLKVQKGFAFQFGKGAAPGQPVRRSQAKKW